LGAGDDTVYRAKLASQCSAFALLRDIAKAQKHVRLIKGTPQVTGEHQVSLRRIGFGEGEYDRGRYDCPQVVVGTNAGAIEYVEMVVDEAVAFLEAEMQRLNV